MLHCQRDAFQLPANDHYLNCAFMSPLMRSVENAGVEGIRQKRNPADIRPADFFDEVNRVRGLFAQLIQAEDSTRVAVVPSASYGLTAAARNLSMEAGQEVVDNPNAIALRLLNETLGCAYDTAHVEEMPEEDQEVAFKV